MQTREIEYSLLYRNIIGIERVLDIYTILYKKV
jgi:hypothetical protein